MFHKPRFCCIFVILLRSFLGGISASEVVCIPGQEKTIKPAANSISYISSVNFPDPYPSFQQTCIVHVEPENGYGMQLLFEQFFIDPDDEVSIYTTNGNISRTGSTADPERGDKAFAKSEGSITVTFQRNSQEPPSVVHSGFRAIVKSFDLAGDDECPVNETLLINSTYFITSPNYPNSYNPNTSCSWTLASNSSYIRILFYDFRSEKDVDFLQIFGNSPSGEDNSQILSGYVTQDLPVAYYYSNEVEISFRSGPQVLGTRRFSFVVDPYNSVEVSSQNCAGAGSHDMSAETNVVFGTNNYGTSAYASNMICNFSFVNPPPLRTIYVMMPYETERCCDIMQVEGVGEDFVFQGQRFPSIYISQSNLVALYFQSDGVRVAAGFHGIASTLDCDCKNSITEVEEGKEYSITAPGYPSSPTYCFNLQCEWSFHFPLNHTMQINSTFIDLRGINDSVLIVDSDGTVLSRLNSLSNSVGVRSEASASARSVTVKFLTFESAPYIETSTLSRGFELKLKSLMYTGMEDVTLSEEKSIHPFTIEVNPGESFHWSVTAKHGRAVTLYIYESLKEHENNLALNIFDGPDVRSAQLTNNIFFLADNDTNTVRSVSSSQERLTFVVSCFATSAATVRISGLLSDIPDAQYSDSCAAPFVQKFRSKAAFTITEPKNNGSCITIFHMIATSDDARVGMAFDGAKDSEALSVYKGATVSSEFLLSTGQPVPSFIFGSDVTILYSEGFSFILQEDTMPDEYSQSVSSSNPAGYLFSPDFLCQDDNGRVYQRYSLSLADETTNGFRVDILKPVVKCQIVLMASSGGKGNFVTEILDGQPSYNICALDLSLIYRSNGGTGKGMFLRYSKVALPQDSCGTSKAPCKTSIYQMIFFTLLIYVFAVRQRSINHI